MWANALKMKIYRKLMTTVQRRGALSVSSSYRTLPEPVVLVKAGVVSIYFSASERKYTFERRNEIHRDAAKKEATKVTIRHWQDPCNRQVRGRWTARFLPNLRKWIYFQHGEVNYRLTQLLSSHCDFDAYTEWDGCKALHVSTLTLTTKMPCTLHTFFGCSRFARRRMALKIEFQEFTPEGVTEFVLRGKEEWDGISTFIMWFYEGRNNRRNFQLAPSNLLLVPFCSF